MLRGSLKSAPLGDVFQLVALSQKSGILTVRRVEKRARIYFSQGRVAYAHMTSGAHLGEILVRMDLITALEVQEILMVQQHENPGTLLGRMAVERGILSEEDLDRAIERQAFDVIGEILSWSDGAFEFRDVDTNASQVPYGRGLDGLMLLMRVVQGIDANGSAVPPEAVFTRSGDPTRAELPEGAWEVLGQVDGRRSARTVAAESDLPDGRAYAVLGQLEALGIVERSPYTADEPLVLIVSQSPALHRIIRLALQRTGVRSEHVAEYADIGTGIAEHLPRAVVIDDVGGGAWELVRELRRSGAHSHLPVLILVDKQPRFGLFRPPPKAEWLLKPFQELELQQLVAKLIGVRQ